MKMNLSCETILDVYTYKNRNVLCQIKINPKSRSFKNSCRSLSPEDWCTFDKELEKVIATIDEWSSEKCLEFNVKPNVQVRVKKSKLSGKKFHKCLGRSGDFESVNEDPGAAANDLVLECMFDFQMEVSSGFSIESQDYDVTLESESKSSPTKQICKNEIITAKTSATDLLECDEIINPTSASYEGAEIGPSLSNATSSSSDNKCNDNDIANATVVQKQNNNVGDEKHSIKSDPEEATHEEKIQTDDMRMEKKRTKYSAAFIENSEEIHVSKKKLQKTTGAQSQHDIKLGEKVLKTTDHKSQQEKEAADIKEKKSTKDFKKEMKDANENKEKTYKKEKKRLEKDSCLKEKNTHSKKELNTCYGGDDVLTNSSENPSIKSESSPEAIDSPPQKVRRRERKLSSTETATSLRRSGRSPTKPKRFMDEQHKLLLAEKHKSSPKSKELFDSDDDDDDFFECKSGNKYNKNKVKSPNFQTPVRTTSVPSNSSSSSGKKKRKRDKSSECQQEKRDMSKWLCKKKPLGKEEERNSTENKKKCSSSKPLPLKTKSKLIKVEGNTENRSKSATPPPTKLEMPSKEEIQLIKNQNKLMQKENAITKAVLNKMRPSSPEAVEILSLQNIPVDEMLDTFSTYKSELDEIYENNYKRDYIKGHAGINHCFVMRLLQQNTQMKMLEKLTEVYENSNGPTQATLFANALLPEWVIRVYMEKFSFTRQKAMEQIKAQEEFQLHMETQNDTTFTFD